MSVVMSPCRKIFQPCGISRIAFDALQGNWKPQASTQPKQQGKMYQYYQYFSSFRTIELSFSIQLQLTTLQHRQSELSFKKGSVSPKLITRRSSPSQMSEMEPRTANGACAGRLRIRLGAGGSARLCGGRHWHRRGETSHGRLAEGGGWGANGIWDPFEIHLESMEFRAKDGDPKGSRW